MHRRLLDEGQDVVQPSARLAPVVPAVGVPRPAEAPAAGGISFREAFVVQTAQGELLEVVLALRLPRRLAGRLDRRQQQRDQDADDRDHDQKFHQRKRAIGSLIRMKNARPAGQRNRLAIRPLVASGTVGSPLMDRRPPG